MTKTDTTKPTNDEERLRAARERRAEAMAEADAGKPIGTCPGCGREDRPLNNVGLCRACDFHLPDDDGYGDEGDHG